MRHRPKGAIRPSVHRPRLCLRSCGPGNPAAAGTPVSAHSVTCALQAVDRLQARGYTFCTVSELAALRGTALLPGEVYTGFPPLDG